MGQKKAKELAEQRKFQKQKAIENKKRAENVFYKIASYLTDGLLIFFKVILSIGLSIFSFGSKLISLLMILVIVFLLCNSVYSMIHHDLSAVLVSISAILVIGIVLYFFKKNE